MRPTTFYLLAGVVAGRVEQSPLRAPLAVWLSMVAVVGLASRPAASRTSTESAWSIRTSVPPTVSLPEGQLLPDAAPRRRQFGSAFH